MSWVEKIQRDLTITLGDGAVFSPNWINAIKNKEYNVTEFNFPEVSGSLVVRKKPKGRRYKLELFFQGDANLDISKTFENSADDERPWVVSHPYYDRIVVQPLSINFDNRGHNVTKITANVIETIEDENPKTVENPTDKIVNDVENLQPILSNAYVKDVIPETRDINFMDSANDIYFSEGSKIASNTDDFETYFNAFNNASGAIVNATSEPFSAIQQLQSVINAPALFATGVKTRTVNLITQFERLINSIANITDYSLKKGFENNGTAFVGALLTASVTNTDYSNRNDVLEVIDLISNTYDNFLLNLDIIQDDNSSAPGSFVPDFDSQNGLNDLVNFTISRLFEIAIEQRQQRSIFLDQDISVVEITHRLLGLDVNDENIDEIINVNNIGLNELLLIKKEREIIYFK